MKNISNNQTFPARIVLAWGVVRRTVLHLCRPNYIRSMHATRQGACKRCGACCRLVVECPHVCDEAGMAACRRHKRTRLPNCVNFPIDRRDLADRNRVAPHDPCGFSW